VLRAAGLHEIKLRVYYGDMPRPRHIAPTDFYPAIRVCWHRVYRWIN